MTRRRAALATVLGVAAIVLLLWTTGVLETPSEDVSSNEPTPGDEDPLDALPPVELEGRGTDDAEPTKPPPLPKSVDLDAVDRRLDIHGVVVRQDDTPVADAALQLFRYPWRRGSVLGDHRLFIQEEAGPSTRTAADGTFAIRCAAGYAGNLRVEAPDLARVTLTNVQAGQRLRIVLSPGARLVVRVRRADGDAAEGVDVHLFRAGKRDGVNMSRRGKTNADGTCTIDSLPAGISGVLSLSHPAYGSAPWINVALADEGETTFEHTFKAGRTLQGRVTDADTDAPIAGARVGMNWVADPYVLTDADGRYALPGWTGENVSQIGVFADGYPHASREVGTDTTIDFALRRGVHLTGRVVAAGEPVRGARVAAVASIRSGVQRVSFATAISGSDGGFAMKGMAHDMPYTIVLMASGHGRTLYDFDAHGEPGGELDLGDLELKPARRIAGVVVDESDRPQPGVFVELAGANADRAAQRASKAPAQPSYGRREMRFTDDLGRFEFKDLAAGTYALLIRPAGGRIIHRDVELPQGRDVLDVRIELAATRPLRVVVLDADDKPIPGVFVTALGRAGGGGKGVTDAKGVVALQVRPDVNQIQIHLIGQREQFVDPRPLPVAPDDEEVVFRVARAATIRGRVLAPGGKGVGGAYVDVEREGEATRTVLADAQGAFTVKAAAGGPVALVFRGQVSENAFVPLEGRLDAVEVGAEGVVMRTTQVPTDRSLTLLVLDPDGEPVAGAMVTVRPAYRSGSLRTDKRGRLELRELAARPTTIQVFVMQPEAGDWIAPERRTVTPDGQGLTFRVRRGLRIEGTVVDGEGAPVAGASVHLRRGGRLLVGGRTKEDGTFSIPVDPTAEGSHELEAVKFEGGRLHRAVLTIDDPRLGTVELKLEPVR